MTEATRRGRAVVTGAGRGIGRAVALALARRDYDVALLGHGGVELDQTAREVRAAGSAAQVEACDVAREDEVERARTAVEAGGVAVDLVVNNAGIVRRGLVHEMQREDWQATLDVNLTGTFLVTRAFLPKMLEQRTGRIVNLGSISSTVGTRAQSAYCASKWGVVGFTKSLAEELRGTGVSALCVMPGSVATRMLEGSGFQPQMTAEDVAKLVVYAALDAPAAMNGSAIEMFGQ